MSKLRSYLFDIGDSWRGPIGATMRVIAESPDEALEIVRDQMHALVDGFAMPRDEDAVEGRDDLPLVEYFRVYFNPEKITLEHMAEIDSV